MQQIQFSCTALNGTGKQGRLPKDSDGYYTTVIGGLNVWNSNGDFYPFEAAKELFNDSGSLMRRVNTGCLKSELGHPKPAVGQSMESFANRVMSIEETNVCGHLAQIWLDFNSIKDDTGRPVVAILAKVAPSGPLGGSLERSLENIKEDVCFSVRGFTEDINIAGIKHRMLRQIITFDNVIEPGISVARKYKSPTLESFNNISFTKDNIIHAIKPIQQGVAMEASQAMNSDLLSILGWDSLEKPNFIKW